GGGVGGLEKRGGARRQRAGEMGRELIAAASGAGPGSPHPAMVAAAGAVTPAPIATPMPIFKEVVAPESNSSVAPLFGEVYAKTGSSRIRVLAVFGALLLLPRGGLRGDINKGGAKKTPQ